MKIGQGGYGHNPSGKLYSYWVPDDARSGQRFVAPVKPPRAKREYNTMFTLVLSKGNSPTYADREEQRLIGMGLSLKSVVGTDVINMLPGGQKYLDNSHLNNIQSMKSAWTKDSNNRVFNELLARLWGAKR